MLFFEPSYLHRQFMHLTGQSDSSVQQTIVEYLVCVKALVPMTSFKENSWILYKYTIIPWRGRSPLYQKSGYKREVQSFICIYICEGIYRFSDTEYNSLHISGISFMKKNKQISYFLRKYGIPGYILKTGMSSVIVWILGTQVKNSQRQTCEHECWHTC